ncbi:MAG: hypothetical protein RLZZ618_3966 [Pseudomonadota bacterium]|jgi:TctA family transporter
MQLVDHLTLGFSTAFTAVDVVCLVVGTLLGLAAALLPRFGPLAVMALLLPCVGSLGPTPTVILLAAVCAGASQGRSLAAMLRPVAAPDASQPAPMQSPLGMRTVGWMSAFAALAAGLLAWGLIALAAPVITRLAFQFGPAEYAALMVLGLTCVVTLGSGSVLKAFAMAVLGLSLGLVGVDGGASSRFLQPAASPISSLWPLVFSDVDAIFPELGRGIPFVVLALGLFGLGQAMAQLDAAPAEERLPAPPASAGARPTRLQFWRSLPAVVRGSVVGGLLGLIPRGRALLAFFARDAAEPTDAPMPDALQQTALDAVAGVEASRRAWSASSLVPLLTLGVPTGAATALLLGAMLWKHLRPGPQLMAAQPALFWGVIVAMALGAVMLVATSLAGHRLWQALQRVPYRVLYPAVVLWCALGAWVVDLSAFHVGLLAAVAVAGYVFSKLDCDVAPLLVGFVLAPLLETHVRGAFQSEGQGWSGLVSHGLAAGLLGFSALLIMLSLLPSFRRRRRVARELG